MIEIAVLRVSMDLPKFRYHLNPLKTGSIIKSDKECESCDKVRGFIYTGSVYSIHSVDDICPWCIADGSAAEKFDASFVANLESDDPVIVSQPIKQTLFKKNKNNI